MPSISRSKLHPLAIRQYSPYGGADRPCAQEGCITLLNGYNPGPKCLIHTKGTEDEDGYMRELDRDLDKAARRTAKLDADAEALR